MRSAKSIKKNDRIRYRQALGGGTVTYAVAFVNGTSEIREDYTRQICAEVSSFWKIVSVNLAFSVSVRS